MVDEFCGGMRTDRHLDPVSQESLGNQGGQHGVMRLIRLPAQTARGQVRIESEIASLTPVSRQRVSEAHRTLRGCRLVPYVLNDCFPVGSPYTKRCIGRGPENRLAVIRPEVR